MKLTFLGTGTSMGVPVAGGFGAEMMNGDPRNERYRTSAWIQTEESSIIIDTGPEFRLQTIRAGVDRVDMVLITHEHMDHMAGLDDLRIYNYKQNGPIPLYTTQSCKEAILRRFEYMFGPDKYPGSVSVDIEVMDETIVFRDLTITPLPVHHGKLDILGYRINDLAYVTDAKEIPESTKDKIRGARLMVLNGLRWSPEHPTHITIPEARDLAEELDIPQTYLVHMNVYVDHKSVNERLPDHVQLAYDQLTVEI